MWLICDKLIINCLNIFHHFKSMKALIESVKHCAVAQVKSQCSRSFLNATVSDPVCQKIVGDMQRLTPEMLGCTGSDDPYHFQTPLNRVVIDGSSEDYRLVLFFIKKGATMPLHDHPNMSVFFRLVFGELKYHGYDKLNEKYKYNDFSAMEYQEMLNNKMRIQAKRTR